MATLQELRSLFSDSDLLEKVEAATVVAASTILSGSPTIQDKTWAASVFSNPKLEASKALAAVLADNAGLTTVQIQQASDVAIQASVDTVAPILVDAFSA